MFLLYIIYPILVAIWHFIGNYFYYNVNNHNFKLSRIHVSAVHASTVIIAYLINVPGYILCYWSVTYFIMDTLYELLSIWTFKSKFGLFDAGILLHHFTSIAVLRYLNYPITEPYMLKAFYLSEISNLPMYLVYHLRTSGYTNKYLMKPLIAIEAIGYIALRLMWGGLISFQIWFIRDIPWFMCLASTIMLAISVVWTTKLVKQILI